MPVEPAIHHGVDMIGTDVGHGLASRRRSAGQRREIASVPSSPTQYERYLMNVAVESPIQDRIDLVRTDIRDWVAGRGRGAGQRREISGVPGSPAQWEGYLINVPVGSAIHDSVHLIGTDIAKRTARPLQERRSAPKDLRCASQFRPMRVISHECGCRLRDTLPRSRCRNERRRRDLKRRRSEVSGSQPSQRLRT